MRVVAVCVGVAGQVICSDCVWYARRRMHSVVHMGHIIHTMLKVALLVRINIEPLVQHDPIASPIKHIWRLPLRLSLLHANMNSQIQIRLVMKSRIHMVLIRI